MKKLICDFCKSEVESLLKFSFIGYTNWNGIANPYIDVEMCGDCYTKLRGFMKEKLAK